MLLLQKSLMLYLNAQEREHAASKVRSVHVDVILRMMVHKAQFPSALAHLRAIIAMIALSRPLTSPLLMITKEVVSLIKETTIILNKSPATDADSNLFNQSSHSKQPLMWLLDPDQSSVKRTSGDPLVPIDHDLFCYNDFS